MSQSRRRKIKYILLEKTELCADDDNESHQLHRGEILEEIPRPDIFTSSGNILLFDIHSQLKLPCPTKLVARLTDFEADSLMGIKSLEERYEAFQARNVLQNIPKKGSKVFVAVKGREFRGIVMCVPSIKSAGPVFGVQLFDEVDVEEDGIPEGSFTTSEQDVFFRLPNGAIGVLVSLEKLRPRFERQESLRRVVRLLEKGEKRLVEFSENMLSSHREAYENIEGLLKTSNQRRSELEKSLTEEKEAHEKTKRRLIETQLKSKEQEENLASMQRALEDKEKDLLSIEKLSDEYEKELTIQQQICKELEQKSDEFKRELACEREARKKAEDRFQKSEQKSKELKTTLAKAQDSLKTRLESEKQCDWMLRREEIHLTEEKLGSGTFGTVYKGMFRGTEVAVKSAHPQITIQNKSNFRREIRMAAMCQHPCMLQFIGATSDDQSPLLVTELLDTSLKNVLKTLRPIEIINIALDVAKGLNYLHLNYPNPIVHRDISSGNVMLKKHGESWQGKVSDYGNAVLMNYAKTGSGGAVPYLAPEMGNQKFSTKSDVYSYGVLLLEMCLKELPSFLDDKDELVCLVKNEEMRSLIRSCIHQDSTQRPSMQKIIVVLKKLSSDMVETESVL